MKVEDGDGLAWVAFAVGQACHWCDRSKQIGGLTCDPVAHVPPIRHPRAVDSFGVNASFLLHFIDPSSCGFDVVGFLVTAAEADIPECVSAVWIQDEKTFFVGLFVHQAEDLLLRSVGASSVEVDDQGIRFVLVVAFWNIQRGRSFYTADCKGVFAARWGDVFSAAFHLGFDGFVRVVVLERTAVLGCFRVLRWRGAATLHEPTGSKQQGKYYKSRPVFLHWNASSKMEVVVEESSV